MIAYYNEIDPFAAEWLRNLIAAGHIAPGEVDTRSIVDEQARPFLSETDAYHSVCLRRNARDSTQQFESDHSLRTVRDESGAC